MPKSLHPASTYSHAGHIAELARLLPLWPHECSDQSLEGRRRRLALLRRALRGERRNGMAGHWTYDLARHAALFACYQREVALAGLTQQAG